jgi:hypothetical protein
MTGLARQKVKKETFFKSGFILFSLNYSYKTFNSTVEA